MRISANFDGGNIQVVKLDTHDDIQLAIRPDAGGEFYQWFNFRFEAQVGQQYTLNIINAGSASYPKGWQDYHAVASYDRQHWFRLPTEYQDGTLRIQLTLECDAI
ncbi:MAG: M14-type cytosolic carboxypeptidase, partial [Shewanella sp.]